MRTSIRTVCLVTLGATLVASQALADHHHHHDKKPPPVEPAPTPAAPEMKAPTAVAPSGSIAEPAPDQPAAPTGAAAGTEEDAKRLFTAGRQAYQDGRFDVAASSFEGAYRIKPVPALLFNLAQTYRKQYLVNQDPETLRRAVEDYRKYLEGAPQGPNRDAAMQALTDLTPILARIAPDALAGKGGAHTSLAVARTEVMVVATSADDKAEVKEAKVSLDGQPATAAPLLAQVKPGEHRATVDAAGFFPSDVTVTAVDGRLVTAEARLKPRPGKIEVVGDSSATVAVDDKVMGKLPLAAPIEVPAGKHVVAVTERGHEGYAAEVAVNAGGTESVDVKLPRTSQRRAVKWLLLLTVISAVATAGAAAVWIQADLAANDLNNKRLSSTITPAELQEYYDDRSRRDDWRTGTYAAIGVTGLLALITAAVYIFDNPEAPRPIPLGDTGVTPGAPGGLPSAAFHF